MASGEHWLVTGADGEAMPPYKNVLPSERLFDMMHEEEAAAA